MKYKLTRINKLDIESVLLYLSLCDRYHLDDLKNALVSHLKYNREILQKGLDCPAYEDVDPRLMRDILQAIVCRERYSQNTGNNSSWTNGVASLAQVRGNPPEDTREVVPIAEVRKFREDKERVETEKAQLQKENERLMSTSETAFFQECLETQRLEVNSDIRLLQTQKAELERKCAQLKTTKSRLQENVTHLKRQIQQHICPFLSQTGQVAVIILVSVIIITVHFYLVLTRQYEYLDVNDFCQFAMKCGMFNFVVVNCVENGIKCKMQSLVLLSVFEVHVVRY
jgi:hypothetical protein